MINPSDLLLIGLLLIFIGFILVFIGIIVSAGSSGKGRVEGGGVIIIGPIPVVFGSNTRIALILLILAIILVVLIYVLFYTPYMRLTVGG